MWPLWSSILSEALSRLTSVLFGATECPIPVWHSMVLMKVCYCDVDLTTPTAGLQLSSPSDRRILLQVPSLRSGLPTVFHWCWAVSWWWGFLACSPSPVHLSAGWFLGPEARRSTADTTPAEHGTSATGHNGVCSVSDWMNLDFNHRTEHNRQPHDSAAHLLTPLMIQSFWDI